MTIRNIMSGFQVTGVYPVNRNALKVTEEPAESLAAATGLAFIVQLNQNFLVKCKELTVSHFL